MFEIGSVIKVFAPTALNAAKVIIPFAVAFVIGLIIAVPLARFLHARKLWKKKARTDGLGDNKGTPIFYQLHKLKETNTPKMGGIVIWVSVLATIFIFWLLPQIYHTEFTEKLNFFSRGQTWLPLFTLIAASLVGLIDDILAVRGRGKYIAGGLSLTERIVAVLLIGAVGGWWFYIKLGFSSLAVPFIGTFDMGILTIPLFMLVAITLFAGGVIDGIDGLSGGVMASIFAGYAGIAFFQDQIDLAAFSLVLSGSTLAFLWYNIPPARFYMSETGMLGLTVTLAVIAFLTRQIPVLFIIALPLMVTVAVNVIQVASKKFRGKKVFLVAPLHHHFEAKGWPGPMVTMRYWIVSVLCALVGMVIAVLG
ncbi:MAG: hypothetical protein Q8P93_02010 [bacterium]|nr:hypothetical protein [bacterium]